MFSVIARRCLIALPTMLAMTFLVFFLVKLIPGDAARLALGDKASEESLETYRQELGLDKPFHIQYYRFMHRLLLQGDLGVSIRSGENITDIIGDKFPATIELALAAIVFAMVIGIPIGLLAALKPGGIIDLLLMGFAVLGVSMPVFWLGLILMWFLGLEMNLFPLSGRLGIEFDYQASTGFLIFDSLVRGDWEVLRSAIHHILLPAITLGTIPLAFLARMTRSALLDVLQQDFVRTAKAKGLKKFFIYLKHALRNAAIPILNITALQFGSLLAGAMITETIFAWPGMGRWILESVSGRDIPAIEGGVLVISMSFIVISLLSDISFKLLDARIKIT